jgi:signal transduction histidine kinase
MKNSLLLIKGKNEPFAALVTAAMENVFPGARIRSIDTVAAAADVPPSGGAEILLLLEPNSGDVAQSREIVDDRKLPRWAVIACEGPLALGNWTSAIAAHLISESWAQQVLRRENATLRGNIRSLGVRVAHDMRTPLGGILSAAETLREGIAETDPSNLVWVDSIIESEADLLKLVRHQTMIADELARPVEVTEFNMGAAVDSAMEWLEGRLTLSNSVVFKPSDWPAVKGDRLKYERIWTLLVDNSIRHGGAGRRIELAWGNAGGSFKFWVSNDGPVIPLEKQGFLFRPFHRLHEPNSGRGLSLSLVEELVYAQGGMAGYELGPQGNPTFYFTVLG